MEMTTAVARLRILAARCREFANTATDPEAAALLRETAFDLESLMTIIGRGQSTKEGDEG